jgi:signal transduction histidine kinase
MAREIPVEVGLQYIELEQGEARFIAIVRDISERLEEEQEKERLQSQLLHAQKLESVGQLAAGIAHEINTPTQFIGNNLDFFDEAVGDIGILMQEVEQIAGEAEENTAKALRRAMEEADWEYLAEELPQAVSQSRDGIKRVSSIVRAMKEFSHPGSKEKEPQNLNQIINTTVTVARNEWKYVADVDLDLDPNLPSVPLLADEIGQAILNMLVNAAHAIGDKLGDNPSGDKGTITITTGSSEHGIELRISDTGAGIPKDIVSRVFDPFFTTKDVGKGTGQGLAIAHDVILKHDGQVRVESTPGEGTTFYISLPLPADNVPVKNTENLQDE